MRATLVKRNSAGCPILFAPVYILRLLGSGSNGVATNLATPEVRPMTSVE